MFWRKNKTNKINPSKPNLYELEKKFTEAHSRYEMFFKTFCIQGSFTEGNRKELMDLKAKRDLLKLELNKFKFEKIVKVTLAPGLGEEKGF